MALWKYSVGNLLSRAALAPVAVSPAVADPVLALSRLGSGYPDSLAALAWRSDGTYDIDCDLNLLAASSTRADAPTGWFDLLNYLAGTPGLPATPPDWGTYGGRTALRFFRPTAQHVDVMPGEQVKITGSIRRPSGAAGATGVEVRVLDLTTGHQYSASSVAWNDNGQIEQQTVVDTWKDFAVTIAADATHTERRTYRVIVSPQAAAYDATSYAYISANGGSGSPALFAEVDAAAILGVNLPVGCTVELQPQPSGAVIPLPIAHPSCYAIAGSSLLAQTWRLSIDVPANLRPSAPRPILGEVWIGKARTWDRSPLMDLTRTEGDPDQVRVVAARGREEIVASDGRPPSSMALDFLTPDVDYVRMRDEVYRLTKFGAEPMLLLPSAAFDGAGRFYHGRVGQEMSNSRITAAESAEAWRKFRLDFKESPLAAM